MRIAIAGGGPGGLYLSILLKRLDPAHEVVVHERNAPGDTFGFGVVFSEETLGRLRDADEPTFTAVTDAWASWTTACASVVPSRCTSATNARSIFKMCSGNWCRYASDE